MHVGVRFGHDLFDAQLLAVHCGHDAAFQVAADADHNHVALLKACVFERTGVGGVAFPCFGYELGELLDDLAVLVDHQDFRASFRETFRK